MTDQQCTSLLRTSVDLPYDEALTKVKAALREQGLSYITQVDIQTMFSQYLGLDTEKYTILGACNPVLAYLTLQSEPEIGLPLLCNVIVYENRHTGTTGITILDPGVTMQITEKPKIKAIADDIHRRLQQVITTL